MISELNEKIARFSGLINTRATCLKTRKQKAKAKAVEAEEKVVAERTALKEIASIDNANQTNTKNFTIEKKENTNSQSKKEKEGVDISIQISAQDLRGSNGVSF